MIRARAIDDVAGSHIKKGEIFEMYSYEEAISIDKSADGLTKCNGIIGFIPQKDVPDGNLIQVYEDEAVIFTEDQSKKKYQEMVTRKTWDEFRNSGFLWWINQILHTFGWAIVVDMDDDKIIDVYPARVKFRGFSSKVNSDGYIKVSNFMKENAEELLKESEE